jgi:hypothetical protein
MPRHPITSSSSSDNALEMRKPRGQPPWTMPYQNPRFFFFPSSSVRENTSLR